jgi:hypothetical protein
MAIQGTVFGDPPGFEALPDRIGSPETRLDEKGIRE